MSADDRNNQLDSAAAVQADVSAIYDRAREQAEARDAERILADHTPDTFHTTLADAMARAEARERIALTIEAHPDFFPPGALKDYRDAIRAARESKS